MASSVNNSITLEEENGFFLKLIYFFDSGSVKRNVSKINKGFKVWN